MKCQHIDITTSAMRECGARAAFVGTYPSGHRQAFCAACKGRVTDARHGIAWEPIQWSTVPTEPRPEPVRRLPNEGVTTCIEHAYGSVERLSFQIRVF